MNISKISPKNFTGNKLKLSCFLIGEKEDRAIYRPIDVDNIECVDFGKKTACITMKNGDWRYITMNDPNNTKGTGYNPHDVLAAINTAKNGIDVII